jgi:Zn-dependent metalloprotease
LPGKLVRREGDPKSRDVAVNEAYDGSGATYDFYKNVFNRNSIDDKGMRLDSSVHYGKKYDNAFWNGQQMVYGDGDGQLFERFTIALDVIGHELTHGVTEYEASLAYQDEPGALNESMSDVFGSMVKQFADKQKTKKADWLIGEGLLTKNVNGVALRSMSNPGSAYDDPVLGKDPQPDNMKDYVKGPKDNGGVHINSGIPNKAFYLAAVALSPSGYSWDIAGPIWYEVLCNRLRPNSGFSDCRDMTVSAASDLFGRKESAAVAKAWKSVGL